MKYLFSFAALLAFLTSIAAWITHIVACLTAGKWGFLIAGAIMFPIAIVHGWLIWLGVV
jgi:hypothetical protein